MPLATGAAIEYRATTAEELAAQRLGFDVVLNMEVVEHVADLAAYLAACARLVRPGGLMFVATLNKTLKSLALAKIGRSTCWVGCPAAPMIGAASSSPPGFRRCFRRTASTP